MHVSRLTNDVSWWVTSASSPEILVSSPNSLQVVHSPLATSGSSTAFEAVVNVVLRMDGSMSAIADDTVMGGSIAGMGPFNGSIRFSGTSSGAGAVTYITRSAQDGSIIEATVVRVRY